MEAVAEVRADTDCRGDDGGLEEADANVRVLDDEDALDAEAEAAIKYSF